jgi:tetratricopeptide (TPR) repeat protein
MEYIKAVSELWPLLLVVVLGIAMIYFRNEIKSLLKKGEVTIKKGDTEFAIKSCISEEIDEGHNQVVFTNDSSTSEELVNVDKYVKENDSSIIDKESKENFTGKMIMAFKDRDSKLIEEIYENENIKEPDNINKIKNTIFYLRIKFMLGATDALGRLEKLADEHKNTIVHKEVLRAIAACYSETDQLITASMKYELLAAEYDNSKDKATYITESSKCLFNYGEHEKAINKIISYIDKESESDALFIYYKELAELYKKLNNTDYYIFTLQKALDYNPNDTGILFNIGHECLNNKYYDLAISYYKKLLKFSPSNAGALNNLAIAYDYADLYGLKIDNYKKSVDLGNTLASANLANNYINIGFYDEALELINQAKVVNDFHANVGKAYADLNDKKNKELETEKELLSKVIQKQDFISRYTTNYFNNKSDEANLIGLWKSESGLEINIEKQDNIFVGTYKKGYYEYKLEGTLKNITMSFIIFRKEYDFSKNTNKYTPCGNVYGYFNIENNSFISLFVLGKSPIDNISSEIITFKNINTNNIDKSEQRIS